MLRPRLLLVVFCCCWQLAFHYCLADEHYGGQEQQYDQQLEVEQEQQHEQQLEVDQEQQYEQQHDEHYGGQEEQHEQQLEGEQEQQQDHHHEVVHEHQYDQQHKVDHEQQYDQQHEVDHEQQHDVEQEEQYEQQHEQQHEQQDEQQHEQHYEHQHEVDHDQREDQQHEVDHEQQYHENQHDNYHENQHDDYPRYEDPDGVDVSWPMHFFSNRHPSAAERGRLDRRYMNFIHGCSVLYSQEECLMADRERMATNYRQPPTMHNYTATGYAKIKAPTSVVTSLAQFYDTYHEKMVREIWPPGIIYANHWASTIKSLPIGGFPHAEEGGAEAQPSLSVRKRRDLIAQVQPILEDWCKTPLIPTGIQGIREYRRGAMIVPTVNRLPFVISAVINVGQDVVDDWPLQVIDHDGKAVNISMLPGDMV